ncbi:MAG: iron ABC transporter permease [Pseudomonadota bacterium]
MKTTAQTTATPVTALKDARLVLSLAGAGATLVFAACLLGSTPLPAARVLAGLFGVGPEADEIIVQTIRLPRALAAYAVGAALGASGAALQGLFRNPLAEPGVLGVSATASLFSATAIYFGLADAFAALTPIAAVAGALVATGFLSLAAVRTRSITTLILVGVGLSAFAGAMMALLLNLAPHPFSLADLVNWSLGSVANRSLDDILLAGPFMAVGTAVLLAYGRGLSALALGEEAARGIGLDVARQRLAIVAGAGLAAGGSVALAGAVGFVGIVAPHLVRARVDHDPERTLVPSALLGGAILVAADIAIRLAPTASELKLGVAAALIGAPAFVLIALERRGVDG